MSTFKSLIYFISFFFILPACKKQATTANQSSPTTNDVNHKYDHKFSKEESLAASEAFIKFVENRGDLKIYRGILKNSGSVIPMLYDDKRLKVSYFIPVDAAFGEIKGEKRKKLEDQVPDDFELQLLSRGIVKAIDFSWSGATSLSGEKLSFAEGMNAIQVGDQSAKILETIPLGNQARVYLIDQLISL